MISGTYQNLASRQTLCVKFDFLKRLHIVRKLLAGGNAKRFECCLS